MRRWPLYLPAAVAAILCLPCLSLGYIWDDYYFLTLRATGDYRSYLLPDPHAAFYRPISQGVTFLFLRAVDPSSGIVGHVLNLLVLIAAVTLLAILVGKLAGRRAGIYSGLFLAASGLVPSLVAWISCDQDLLAVALVLAALLLRHERRNAAALACATAALLCKEPALAAFPILILWDRLVGRAPERERIQWGAYLAVALVWAAIHPGIRHLAARGFASGATGYVGLEHPERWGLYLARYVATLFNLTPPGLTASWWSERVRYGLLAVGVMVLGLFFSRPKPSDAKAKRAKADSGISYGRIVLVAALLGIPTLLMPTLLIRHWAPYFAFFPATALAVAVGPLLARRPAAVSIAALAVFLLLGARYRGIRSDQEPVWTERVLVDAADAVHTVRANFHYAVPSIPKGAQVVVSVSSTGVRGIYSTLIDGQALRIWYGDPTLRAVTTLRRAPNPASEILVRVTTDLDVISIDPDSRRIRSSSTSPPDLSEVGRPLVNYARAVAAAGDTPRALVIVESLAESEVGANRAFIMRVSAMIRLAAGERGKAGAILAALPPLTKEDALWSLKPFLNEPSPSEPLDLAAFEAFGLSATDPEALRWIMQHFRVEGSLAQAAWYAQWLRRIVPGDPEAIAILNAAERAGIKPSRESA
ncbi:MAG: hypothetical protein ACRENN_00635 [Candidatus Eiseniibacteriota bacterium]